MRAFTVPMIGFFFIVAILLFTSLKPADYQQAQQAVGNLQNSSTVRVSMSWLPCLAAFLLFIGAGAWVLSAFSGGFEADTALNIGRTKEVEPEVTSDGSYIGYRYLAVGEYGYMSVTSEGIKRNGANWGKTGYLESHAPPNENNKAGIYAVKRWDDPELRKYKGEGRHLVKVKLWGSSIVVGTKGYRAQKALVVEDYGEV